MLLTSIVPTPRPVVMAGRSYLVRPATIRMLAELQQWVDARTPGPFAGVWPLVYGADALQGDERFAAIGRALANAPEPVEWDSPDGASRLATIEGLAFTVWLGCRPEVSPEVAAQLASRSAVHEIAEFRRTFYGVDPEHELYMLFFADLLGPSGQTATWGEAMYEIAERTGWTLPQIYDLTLAEFGMIRRGGKAAPRPSPSQGSPGAFQSVKARLSLARVRDDEQQRSPGDRPTVQPDAGQPVGFAPVQERGPTSAGDQD